MEITRAILLAIMPACSPLHIDAYAKAITATCQEFGVDNVERCAHFIGQIAVETGECRYLRELDDGARYEGRADLGNKRPGDGPRYKGRGAIQLTGRDNYRAFGRMLGLDLEGHPELVERIDIAFRVAGAYWVAHRLNHLADVGDIKGITRRINGGLTALEARRRYTDKARTVLGVAAELARAGRTL